MNNGTMEVKQDRCEVLSDKESDHMDVDVQAEYKAWQTNYTWNTGRHSEKRAYVCECTCICE